MLTGEQGKCWPRSGQRSIPRPMSNSTPKKAKRIAGETLPSARSDGRVIVLRQPAGVLAALTPWNFPASMITRKVAPARASAVRPWLSTHQKRQVRVVGFTGSTPVSKRLMSQAASTLKKVVLELGDRRRWSNITMRDAEARFNSLLGTVRNSARGRFGN
ncbi:aldehyde dehydrogenase family protein [Mesorhizobium mediterraneum]|uniref:aldehyde dehydrogenase family protein n=1 Tax=Mesorhizobium mediterraneum TaxID=43617 RepID=UPI003D7C6984